MSRKLPNYLRTYRKHTALSQDEVAFLLGSTKGSKGSKVSRHEQSARVPSIEALLAYELIFGASSRELFAGTFEKVEQLIRERAQVLVEKLSARDLGRSNARKLEVLHSFLRKKETDSHELK